jgi:hypothetical protein
MRKLLEGMRAGDLSDLVLPLISVDEYESKITAKAVAIGFYVHDKDAANDLNRFLQKSPVALLSTEVSPAPDQHGFFIVFIELMPDNQIANNIETLLKEIEPLCEISEWKMRVRKTKGLIKFSKNNFAKALKIARIAHENVLAFLTKSTLNAASIHGETLLLEAFSNRNSFKIVDFDTTEAIANNYGLTTIAEGIELYDFVRCQRLTTMLGEGWSVKKLSNFLFVEHNASTKCLLLIEETV